MPDEILLIDLSAIFRSAWHASVDQDVSVAFQATLDSVRRAKGMFEGVKVAICCDGRGNWRKELSPDYKAQREKQPESMYGQLDRAKARLKADGHLLWEFEGFEADDVIATATDAAIVMGHPVVIASHDKDLLQLLCDSVRALSTSTWTVRDAAAVKEKFGVAPAQLGDWLALVGDKSDNIAGCEGVGEKTAAELLNKFGTLKDLYAAAHDIAKVATDPFWRTAAGKPKAFHDALLRCEEKVMLARKLVSLSYDVPLKLADVFAEREVKPLTERPMTMGDDVFDAPEISTQKEATERQKDRQVPPGDSVTAGPIAGVEAEHKAPVGGDLAASAPAPVVETKEMTVAAPVDFERALEPRSPSGVMQMAEVLFNSRMYPRFSSPMAIAAVMIRGRALGLGAGVSLDVIHWLEREGRMALHAHLIISMAESHPDCEYFMPVHTDNEYAEYETKNRKHPKPVKHRYSIDDAVAAGIATKEMVPRTSKPGEKDSRGNWDKRRAEMLRKTAGVQLARMVYPSAALGLYSVEELES